MRSSAMRPSPNGSLLWRKSHTVAKSSAIGLLRWIRCCRPRYDLALVETQGASRIGGDSLQLVVRLLPGDDEVVALDPHALELLFEFSDTPLGDRKLMPCLDKHSARGNRMWFLLHETLR